jgi:hypothetical protein
MPFAPDDPIDSKEPVMRAIDRFVAGARSETLFLIHPDPLAVGARALETFVVRLGQRLRQTLSFADLSACSRPIRAASSQSAAFSHGVPSFQLLSHTQLKETSDALLQSGYYNRFTPEMLRAVGMPRA